MTSKEIPVAKISTESDVESLAEFSEGDMVTYGDDQIGVVVSKMTSSFEWPSESVPEEEQAEVEDDEEVDEGMSKLDAGDDNPIYVVARASGGSQPFRGEDLNKLDEDPVPDEKTDPEDIADAEMAPMYAFMKDPYSIEEFHRVAELANIPGVDDPEVGFSSWPDSWEESEKPARLIALDAWSSLGGTFTSCVADMTGDISRPKRFCAAFKDEMLGTERWRNRF